MYGYRTAEEMARLMNRDIETVRRQIRAGIIPAEKMGRSYFIPDEEFKKQMEVIQQTAAKMQKVVEDAGGPLSERASQIAAWANAPNPQLETTKKAAKDTARWMSQNQEMLQKAEQTVQEHARLMLQQAVIPGLTEATRKAQEIVDTLRRDSNAHFRNSDLESIAKQAQAAQKVLEEMMENARREARDAATSASYSAPASEVIFPVHRQTERYTEAPLPSELPVPSSKKGRAAAAKALRDLAAALEMSDVEDEMEEKDTSEE